MMQDRDITELIADVRQGNETAAEHLFRRVYQELRQLAGYYTRCSRRRLSTRHTCG
jgi:ECF sigma factor